MYTEFNCAQLTQRTQLTQRKSKPASFRDLSAGQRWISLLSSLFTVPFLLMGCADSAISSDFSQQTAEAVELIQPEGVPAIACDVLMQQNAQTQVEDPRHWLQLMACIEALDLDVEQARVWANQQADGTWQGYLKQAILLSDVMLNTRENQMLIEGLDSRRVQYPAALHSLVQLWRQQYLLQRLLQDEKTRHQQLQESTSSKIGSLQRETLQLQQKLHDISLKLKNLTDIERQLSSRKQQQGEISASGIAASKVTEATKPEAQKPPAAKLEVATPAASASTLEASLNGGVQHSDASTTLPTQQQATATEKGAAGQ
ncbi:two-component system QseEF-associated lipoprotein QseG [Serratia microhaemolytica]|uniref:two-component system QseEF-associated lipoprotein QseG n=1 Tax=Serratia microhaemolytica TaxID=2675110 RepID=UPI000FDE5F4E|nr:two-component system QseEF-associated lipoprotein QseG [Serratia microhaemolytica]